MALLTKDSTALGPSVHLPESRTLFVALWCAAATFGTVALSVRWQLTTGFERGVLGLLRASRGSAGVVSRLLPTTRRRRAVLGVGIAVSFVVGASRVVLGVHWPTDAIASWALGTAVAAATLLVTTTTRRPG